LSLATRAFRDLPETHMYKQAVVRLCQGAADKEAGSYASNIRPKNIEEAIDKISFLYLVPTVLLPNLFPNSSL
jgi:hypothetical protein